jgi:hypothetical protein
MNSIFPFLVGALVLAFPGLVKSGSTALAADVTNKLEVMNFRIRSPLNAFADSIPR